MGNNVGKQIRERIGVTLTGLATTGSRVYQSRVYPIQAAQLPCLLIYTTEESSGPVEIGAGTRLIERRARVVVEAVVKAVSNFDDTLDTIAKEVEIAIAGDVFLNNLVHDCALTETRIRYIGESDQPVAVAQLIYTVSYFNREDLPDTAV